MSKRKIIKISIYLAVIILLSITCIFNSSITKSISNLLFNNFNIIINRNDLLVHFVDVGQGDAIAINLPNDEIMLIDCGPKSSNVAYTKYLTEKVLNSRKNKTIDYLILTHADADHVGGALKVLQSFDVEKVFMPTIDSDSETYRSLHAYVKNNCEYEQINRNIVFDVEDCKIEIFGLYNLNNSNDNAPVIKLTYLSKSFMFMADVSANIEMMLIEEYSESLDSDVLKIAHHGSGSSTSIEFLQATSPDFAIISVGQNSYGHPTEQVLSNIDKVDAKILRTDIDENIIFAVDDSSNLKYKIHSYYVTETKLNYIMIISVIDVLLIVDLLIVVKTFKNKKRIDN